MGRGEAAIRAFERGDTKDSVFALALQHVLEVRGITFLTPGEWYKAMSGRRARCGIEGPDDRQTEPESK
jgi:hypothetical protein